MSNIPSFLYGQIFQTPSLPTKNLTGHTYIITGANTGLGLDSSKHLARLGASHLILACRNKEKGEKARKDILQDVGNGSSKRRVKIEVWLLDMCSYASVLAFAERCKTLTRIDGVIANAGVDLTEYSRAEDNETTITVNVVSTFLLSILLLPVLRASAQQHANLPHLTIVGSAVHLFAPTAQLNQPKGKIFATLNDPKTADMVGRYNLSKLLVMFCTREFAAQVSAFDGKRTGSAQAVVVNCVNPGWCKTELFREHNKTWGIGPAIALKAIGRTSEMGSRTLVHAVCAGTASHGQYVTECQVKPPSQFVRSQEGKVVQERVWDELMGKLEVIKSGIARNL